MTKRLVHLTIFAALCLLTACEKNSATTPQPPRTYTKAQLNGLIVTGMSGEDLEKQFGPPGSKTENLGVVLWYYTLPIQRVIGVQLAGFTVRVKNNAVVGWDPIEGSFESESQDPVAANPAGSLPFEFYLATNDALLKAAAAFDPNAGPGIADSNATPDLAFKAKVSFERDAAPNSNRATVFVLASAEDGGKLQDFTARHMGGKLLIYCNGRLVSASLITEPFAGRFMFRTKDQAILENAH